MTAAPTKRRRRPNLSEQVQILARQARCALSGEIIGDYRNIEWDHKHERALSGPDAVDNWQAVLKVPHKIKTNGTKATSAGSSKHKVAKVRRLVKKGARHAEKLASKSAPVQAGDLLRKTRQGWCKITPEPGDRHAAHLAAMRRKAGL